MTLSRLSCLRRAPALYSSFVRMFAEHRQAMAKVKVNLTLDADVAATARQLGLNMSRLAETAIADAAKAERNRRWREEYKAALDSYAEEVDREGLALARFRSF